MELPFTAEQFFGVLRAYNTTLGLVQVLLLALAGSAGILFTQTPAVSSPAFAPEQAGAMP